MRRILIKTNGARNWEEVDAAEIRVELGDGHVELTVKKTRKEA